MRVSGNLAKFAITWPFGHFWSRFLRQNLFQSFHVKCMLIRVYCNFRQSAIGPFKQGQLFRRFLKNLPCSPLFTFSENAGVWWPCDNCNNLPIRTLLEPLFAPKSSPFFFSLLFFLCTFLENAGLGWLCENCHNLVIQNVLELLFAPNSSSVFALLVDTM